MLKIALTKIWIPGSENGLTITIELWFQLSMSGIQANCSQSEVNIHLSWNQPIWQASFQILSWYPSHNDNQSLCLNNDNWNNVEQLPAYKRKTKHCLYHWNGKLRLYLIRSSMQYQYLTMQSLPTKRDWQSVKKS